jgi:hypothetical protein
MATNWNDSCIILKASVQLPSETSLRSSGGAGVQLYRQKILRVHGDLLVFHVLARFTKIPEERPSSSESSKSVLQAEDWWRIEILLRKVVSDVYHQDTKILSSTMHHLSTENIILKLRCQGLEEALVNEKKRHQRGKPLLLQLQDAESGNAVFYSPRKIQQARDLQREKEEAIQAAKTSKEEAKLRRQQEKEEKKRIIEEKRQIQASNKQLRLQQAEEKERQKEAVKEEARIVKEAESQLQNDIRTTKNGKKKQSIPSTPQNKPDIIAQTAEVVEEASTTINHRGRQIRLPHRFRDD